MDSLKSLLDSKNYELVIKLTETSQSANDLFYRISAFIYLGKYEEALYVIQDHQAVLESNLPALINAHINLLCVLGRFEQAYTTLDYYANLPYQSQVVEEILRDMPKLIEAEEKKQTSVKYYDDDQIMEMLNSKEDQDILLALDIIKSRDIFAFLLKLKEMLLSHPREVIKSYILMLLVKKELDRDLAINKNGKEITINPKHIEPPFSSKTFNEVIRSFDSKYKDTTIAQTATQLFSQYEIYLYPVKMDKPANLYSAAMYLIASNYVDPSKDEEALNCAIDLFNVNKEELLSLRQEIDDCLKNF